MVRRGGEHVRAGLKMALGCLGELVKSAFFLVHDRTVYTTHIVPDTGRAFLASIGLHRGRFRYAYTTHTNLPTRSRGPSESQLRPCPTFDHGTQCLDPVVCPFCLRAHVRCLLHPVRPKLLLTVAL